MAANIPLVLPADVVLTPVSQLPAEFRAQIGCEEGDYTISRPRSRASAKVIDAGAAQLLEEFRTPSTIVEAVIRHSRSTGTDAEETLDQAYPVLRLLAVAGLLVAAESDLSVPIVQRFEEGSIVAGCRVLRCLQVLEDTELYQVKRPDGEIAVLKALRPAAGPHARRLLVREELILRLLDGAVNPVFWMTGDEEGLPYLGLSWCPGVDLLTAAAELRSKGQAGHSELLELCCRVAEAYAHLHLQNVLHGDVHPRNLLVGAAGQIWIIDYGYARQDSADVEEPEAARGGVSFFFEPEYARAILDGGAAPAVSRAGEQYSVAALLYLALCGTHHHEFALERMAHLRQLAHDAPLPFEQAGARPCPGVEAVLLRALSLDPDDRYPSMASLAHALREAADRAGAAATPPAPAAHRRSAVHQVLGQVLQEIGPGSEWFTAGLPQAPTCSVNSGAAGVAYALYRLAGARDSAHLLALADVWNAKALRESSAANAFDNPDLEATPETLGRISPYHTRSGLYCVQALIDHAMGNPAGQQAAIRAAVEAWKLPGERLDLTLGRCGALVAGSLLLDTVDARSPVDVTPLRELGQAVLDGVWQELDLRPEIGDLSGITSLGIAHGWAGFLYATLRWCQSSGCSLPAGVKGRLDELAALAEPVGRGARWKWSLERPAPGQPYHYMPGWCNGSAGHVFLWVLAHRVLGGEESLRLAELAAWNAWEEPAGVKDLCCGLAGRAYALLCMFRLTDERQWLERARQLADGAVTAPLAPHMARHSLYKGDLGIALLAADLDRPEDAAMPFFEAEGW